MNPQTHDLPRLLARLDRLEKQNRLWRFLTLAVVLGIGAAFVMGAGGGGGPAVQDRVVAKRLEVVDAAGKTRLVMDTLAKTGVSRLLMADADGQTRFSVVLDPKRGANCTVYDKTSKTPYVQFGESPKGGFVTLRNQDNVPAFSANDSGTVARGGIQVVDVEGKPRATIGMGAGDQPNFSVLDANQKIRAQLGFDSDKGSFLLFNDAAGKRLHLHLGANANGGFLNVWDSNNQLIFRQPK